ncbi:MAG: alpha/beta hydrolase [Kiloniellales bacterium]
MADIVFRHYDQAGLDRQLNLRARWPEHAGYFARWASESAVVRARLACRLDLAFGPGAAERLDFFPAALQPPGGAPLLAFIHGGYWQGLDKGDFSYLAPPFVGRGIAFASLNYTLAPAGRVAQMVEEVGRALAWLLDRAGSLGIDASRVLVAGHSAGGHLAVAALAGQGARNGHTLLGACSISGVYDLEPIRLSYHQAVVGIDRQTVAACSPVRMTPPAGARVVCAVGGEETDEFLRQQADFVATWRGQGAAVSEVPLPGRNHFTAADALAEPSQGLFRAVTALLQP